MLFVTVTSSAVGLSSVGFTLLCAVCTSVVCTRVSAFENVLEELVLYWCIFMVDAVFEKMQCGKKTHE